MTFWAVAQTESQREQVAAEFLKQASFETYLPKIAVRDAARRERVVPLFPAYIFVQVVDRWYDIRWTVGVLRLLMAEFDHPAMVPDKVIAAIQRREGENGLVRLPKPRGIQRGDRVRVTRGSFVGHLAVYDGMNGPDRSRLLVELMGRQCPVSIRTCEFVAAETKSTPCAA